MTLWARIRRWIDRLRPRRIGFRLLAFNLLILFFPVAGILYLDVYERELLAEQERGMVQEARGIAAALGGSTDLVADSKRTVGVIAHQGSRVRIFDGNGVQIADSGAVQTPTYPSGATESATDGDYDPIRENVLYRIAAWVVSVTSSLGGGSDSPPVPPRGPGPPEEVRTALAGKYGAATRPTPGQRSLTLTSVLPIRVGGNAVGAVSVSQTTYRTLSALYRVRLRLFKIILVCVAGSVLLSVLVAGTVVRPLDRLRLSALAVSSRLGSLTDPLAGTDRKDEIGDLARALHELTHRLDDHIKQVEASSADVAHELRNPLAAIRIAAETIATTNDPAERQRFLDRLTKDVDRLDRLVSGVRDLATLDAQIAHEPRSNADVHAVVRSVADGLQLTGGVPVSLSSSGRSPLVVRGSSDRLAQVFENIIGNARSFSPDGQPVTVAIDQRGGYAHVSVLDHGPGIPEAHADRIFERFFTYRPNEPAGRREHAGLGLAIAKSIVEGYGGTVTAANREGGGARFDVRLPITVTSSRP